MIRRRDGNDWLLIGQVDHAQLAADLASAWGNDLVAPLPFSELLVSAIRHHDDGWAKWERSPTINPDTGIPRDFTEMPMDASTRIWNDSIQTCADIAPEAGIWISRHFWWLAARARDHRKANPEDLDAIHRFLEQQTALQYKLRAECCLNHPDRSLLDQQLEAGFRSVQFFDRVSLWVCCARRTEPFRITLLDDTTFEFRPLDESHFTIHPYPINVPALRLHVQARRLAAHPFADDTTLRHQLAQTLLTTLVFEMRK